MSNPPASAPQPAETPPRQGREPINGEWTRAQWAQWLRRCGFGLNGDPELGAAEILAAISSARAEAVEECAKALDPEIESSVRAAQSCFDGHNMIGERLNIQDAAVLKRAQSIIRKLSPATEKCESIFDHRLDHEGKCVKCQHDRKPPPQDQGCGHKRLKLGKDKFGIRFEQCLDCGSVGP